LIVVTAVGATMAGSYPLSGYVIVVGAFVVATSL